MLPTIIRTRRNELPSIFDEFFGSHFTPSRSFAQSSYNAPKVNVEETDSEFLLEVAAPGFDKKDLSVKVEEGILTIESKKEEEKNEENDHFIRREFGIAGFKRSFTLPEEVDTEKIKASHKNGVLHVTIPKSEVVVEPAKEISIS